MMDFVFDMLENTVGKGENAGNQHFLLFPQCFQKALSSGLLKLGIFMVKEGKHDDHSMKSDEVSNVKVFCGSQMKYSSNFS